MPHLSPWKQGHTVPVVEAVVDAAAAAAARVGVV